MSSRNTVFRSAHDLGLAAWFGGSLAGVTSINGTASDAPVRERTRYAANGWARWAPISAAAIGIHAIGGLGLINANRGRLRGQAGAGSNTAIKAALTVAAAGTTAWSGLLGARLAAQGQVPAQGATEPSAETPAAAASAQRQLKILQWATPVLTAVLIVLGAVQGEQQRPTQIIRGAVKKAADAVMSAAG